MSTIFDPDQISRALASTSLAMDAATAMQSAACERIAFLERMVRERDARVRALEEELEAEGREVERLRAGVARVLGRAA